MSKAVYNFKKSFRFSKLFAIAIGGTISSTYFLGNSYLYHQLGPFTFLIYIAGGLITYLVMNAMAELAGNENPSHLSFVKYAYDHLSPSVACGVGYSYWLNWILYIPTECLAGGFLLNAIYPAIPIMVFAFFIALLITATNLMNAKFFGDSAEWFTYTHMLIFVIFAALALGIYFGLIGNNAEFLKTRYLLQDGGAFPNGFRIFFLNGIVLLLNLQGAEIIGLSASETHEAKQEVPKTMKEIAPSITVLYALPMLLLALIYPWHNPAIEGSIFSRALESYGFKHIGVIFAFLIVFGAIAVSNSGIYAASRCSHAMAHYKMLPRYFIKLSNLHTPTRLSLFTCLLMFCLLILTLVFPSAKFYDLLLSLSGFSGTICWVSICVSQIALRKKLSKTQIQNLNFKDKLFPYGTFFVIFIMLFCMFYELIAEGSSVTALLGTLSFLVPYLLHKFIKRPA